MIAILYLSPSFMFGRYYNWMMPFYTTDVWWFSRDSIVSRNHSAHCGQVIHGPLAKHVNLRVAHAPGNPGTFSPPPRVRNPYMHHSTCVTHVSWCMAGSLTSGFLGSRWRGNVLGIPSACTTRKLRIWVDAHVCVSNLTNPPRHTCLLSVFSTNWN